MQKTTRFIVLAAIVVLLLVVLTQPVYAAPVMEEPPETEDVPADYIAMDPDGRLWYMPDAFPLDFLTDEQVQDILRYVDYTKLDEVPEDTRTNAEICWDMWYGYLHNAYGVAGLMGNMAAESGFNPRNMENRYERNGLNDNTYTQGVDNGTYTNFVHDSVGYGLVQWTYSGYKRDLLAYAKSQNSSIGDIYMQNQFLYKQFHTKNLLGVLDTLTKAKTVRAASDCVLLRFERPADQSTAVQERRAGYANRYYNELSYRCEMMDDISASVDEMIHDGLELYKAKLVCCRFKFKVIQLLNLTE